MNKTRLGAFLSETAPEIFHSVEHSQDVWREDPFDVPEVHAQARACFERLVERALADEKQTAGRILLLKGEAGSGKTHLMRAFRSYVHGEHRGYFAYMQMTSSTKAYDRYVLQNLVGSLDQPYWPPQRQLSSLRMLSDALADKLPRQQVVALAEVEDVAGTTRLANELSNRLVDRLYLPDLDIDLLRALLLLQVDRPSVKIRVIKYLRAEPLSDYDREILGNIAPRASDEDPLHLVGQLAGIMRAFGRSVVVCLDQLEDIYHLDEARERFANVMDTVKQLGEIPGAVVVLSCLESYYKTLRGTISNPVLARVESDPAPMVLVGERTPEEVRRLIGQRLRYLFEIAGVPWDVAMMTDPIPDAVIGGLRGTARDVIRQCLDYREAAQAEGCLPPRWPRGSGHRNDQVEVTEIRQLWNDFRSGAFAIPDDEQKMADLLRRVTSASGHELGVPGAFTTDSIAGHPWFRLRIAGSRENVPECLVAVCDKPSNGTGLISQLDALDLQPGIVPVVVRSTEFPKGAQAKATKILGKLVAKHQARPVVVQNSDLRNMAAYFSFEEKYRERPDFQAFLEVERPLTSLESVRQLLNVSDLRLERRTSTRPVTSPSKSSESATVQRDAKAQTGSERDGPTDRPVGRAPSAFSNAGVNAAVRCSLRLGETLGRVPAPVDIDPEVLKRHVAFMGGTGSGKTTAALRLIEGLLDQGVSAVLVDRKGDLCGYADPDVWQASTSDPLGDALRMRLKACVEVALFTPGNPKGRSLRVPLLPRGTHALEAVDREQIARVAASALADMLTYGKSQKAQGQRAVIQVALEQLAAADDAGAVSLVTLRDYLRDPDDTLIVNLGALSKFIDGVCLDLEILEKSKGTLLGEGCEPLDASELFGEGLPPGKTRLSIVSTKFLGASADVQFWVAQLLLEIGRWFARNPSGQLKGVIMLDEADIYLPAMSQPATKGPVEELLRRARSMGLSVFLATQSPGDLDYKCRDNIRTWLVGLLTQSRAIEKVRPMFDEVHADSSALSAQKIGEFHLVTEGRVSRIKVQRNVVQLPSQVPDEQILQLAAVGRPKTNPS